MTSSEQRKRDHLHAALAQNPTASPFDCFHLVHRCLPELALKEVDLSVNLFGYTCGAPLYINAMTGGHTDAEGINESLGAIAARFDIPIAVGSQSIALQNPQFTPSFTFVRKRNSSGVVWANLSAGSSLEQARSAIEMINAQALQLHLNAPQELAMLEGDRDFSGWLHNIDSVAQSIHVPVIAKEVGFGIAFEEARQLGLTHIAALDISGAGGTDFLKVEQSRHTDSIPLSGLTWGIPTPIALIESTPATTKPIFASGGIDTPIAACIALALGASAVGLGRALLRWLVEEGESSAAYRLQAFIKDMALIMAMQGCRNISELQHRPVVITGSAKEWLDLRGFKPHTFAQRMR